MAVIFLDDYRGHLTQGKKFKEGKIGELNKKDEADLVRRGIAEYVDDQSNPVEVLVREEAESAKPEKKEKPAKKK